MWANTFIDVAMHIYGQYEDNLLTRSSSTTCGFSERNLSTFVRKTLVVSKAPKMRKKRKSKISWSFQGLPHSSVVSIKASRKSELHRPTQFLLSFNISRKWSMILSRAYIQERGQSMRALFWGYTYTLSWNYINWASIQQTSLDWHHICMATVWTLFITLRTLWYVVPGKSSGIAEYPFIRNI